VAGASSGASCTTLLILTRWRSPVGRLRRCVPPVRTARRCLPFCLAPPALPLAPARRGYGYGSGGAVADGTAGVLVQACQGSYAPLPPARRGYGYGSGSAVVDGMPIVLVQACQGSYAPPSVLAGVVRQTGRATGARARHKTRNTTDIRESCARLGVSRPTENGAFRCFKKAAPFSVARGAIFHNLLKRQKIAPVLTRRARAAQLKIGCVARLNRIYRCSTACLAGTGELAPNARTESRAARG